MTSRGGDADAACLCGTRRGSWTIHLPKAQRSLPDCRRLVGKRLPRADRSVDRILYSPESLSSAESCRCRRQPPSALKRRIVVLLGAVTHGLSS
jgi:hypothetical protein